MCKWLSVEGESPGGTVPLRDSDRLVMPSPPPLRLPSNHPTAPRQPAQTNILIVIEFLGRALCDGGQIGRERTGDGSEATEDEDGGRWSGGKVRAVTEVEIEQEGGGNGTVLKRKVDDSAESEDEDGAARELLGISFVSALDS